MRVNIVGQGGYSSGGLSITGAILTGPLTLSRDPVEPLEATTKRYVDLAANSLDASKVTTGTLSAARLPAFTGDLTSTQGNNILTLGNTGVVPGTYSKVTVDAKGRVSSGGSLAAGDIPPLSWAKITTGKPTTLAGYGITNGVSLNGDNVTGYVTAHADPVSGLQLATKQYVDGKAGTGTIVPTGGTIQRTNATTPSGYLRCNGSLVSKTTYPDLYAIIGDNVVSEYNAVAGSGQPWRQQYAFNTTQSSDITGWTTGTSLPGPLSYSQAIVTKNRVYLLGGWATVIDSVATVYTAPINGDGTLGAWTTGPSLPGPLSGSQAIVTKNRVYLLGGYTAAAVATVYTAPINGDGTLGAWTTGPSLPVTLYSTQAIVTQNRVYLLGGWTTAAVATVYTAPINGDGTLGTWSTGPSLPGPLSYSQAIVTKNRVYLLGGSNGSSLSTVYTAPIDSDGTLGTWSTGTSLPGAVNSSQAIVTKNRVYLLGGYTTAYVATVYTAPINSDGTLGTWSAGTSLPGVLANSQAIVTQNRVYLLGGASGTGSHLSTVYTAPFSGGLNDYSTFYTTGYTATDPDNFRLPDTTLTDTGGLYTYIKT